MFCAKLSSYCFFYAVESLRQNPKKKEYRRANIAVCTWLASFFFQSDVVERAHAQVVDVRRGRRRGEEGVRGVEGTAHRKPQGSSRRVLDFEVDGVAQALPRVVRERFLAFAP